MVEPKSKQVVSSEINLEQLVHMKAYETGHLTFDKNITCVPGYLYGT